MELGFLSSSAGHQSLCTLYIKLHLMYNRYSINVNYLLIPPYVFTLVSVIILVQPYTSPKMSFSSFPILGDDQESEYLEYFFKHCF